LTSLLEPLFRAAEANASGRDLELGIWKLSLEFGRTVLMVLLALQARRATQKDILDRRLARSRVSLRFDKGCWNSLTTTFGPVCFPMFAYRENNGTSTTTRTPARNLFPLHPYCRSSELCLQWEARLGSEHPFRTAQQALKFYTHDAVSLEDTTIASHTTAVGSSLDWRWTYRPVEEIRQILQTRATRNTKTGRPILYASCDAHALRRFVDDTWDAQWKMTNGLRLWCVDSTNNETIHLGGEYTWGDCNEVENIVRRLITSGHLPADGNYGQGVVAHVAWITDGAAWLEERILKLFPTARVILDAYHALEHLASFAATVWSKGHALARQFNDRAYEAAFGAKRQSRAKPKVRRGHVKRPKAPTAMLRRRHEVGRRRKNTTDARLILRLLEQVDVSEGCAAALANIVRYVTNNGHRMDYARYIKEGYAIGSGAMESLHRVGSQLRLKRSGSGWLPETSKAIFNLRMMTLAGRRDEFWSQPCITDQLVTAFHGASHKSVV
jgi:hypothetical protein